MELRGSPARFRPIAHRAGASRPGGRALRPRPLPGRGARAVRVGWVGWRPSRGGEAGGGGDMNVRSIAVLVLLVGVGACRGARIPGSHSCVPEAGAGRVRAASPRVAPPIVAAPPVVRSRRVPATVVWDERVSPQIDCNPVKTQHTLVVTVLDQFGCADARPARRVDPRPQPERRRRHRRGGRPVHRRPDRPHRQRARGQRRQQDRQPVRRLGHELGDRVASTPRTTTPSPTRPASACPT